MFLFNALQFCATDKSNLPSYTGINWDGRLWRVGRCRCTLNRWKWRKFCTLDAPGRDKSLFRWESRLVLKLEGVLCFAKADAILELMLGAVLLLPLLHWLQRAEPPLCWRQIYGSQTQFSCSVLIKYLQARRGPSRRGQSSYSNFPLWSLSSVCLHGLEVHTEIGQSRWSRLRECCRQACAEVITTSSSKIHQTWCTDFCSPILSSKMQFPQPIEI